MAEEFSTRGIEQDHERFEREQSASRVPKATIENWLVSALVVPEDQIEGVVTMVNQAVTDLKASYEAEARRSTAAVESSAIAEENRKGDPLPPEARDSLAEESRLAALQEPDSEDEDYTVDDIDEGTFERLPPVDPTDGPGMSEEEAEADREIREEAAAAADRPVVEVLPVATEDTVEAQPASETRATPKSAPGSGPGIPSRRARVAKLTTDLLRQRLAEAPRAADARVFDEITKLEGQIADMTKVLNELKASVNATEGHHREIRNILQATAVHRNILPEAEGAGMDLEEELSEAKGRRMSGDAPAEGRPPRPAGPRRFDLVRVAKAVGGFAVAACLLVAAYEAYLHAPGLNTSPQTVGQGDRLGSAKRAANCRAAYLRGERKELETVIQVAVESEKLLREREQAFEVAKAKAGVTPVEISQAEFAVREATQLVETWGANAARARANLVWVKARLPE